VNTRILATCSEDMVSVLRKHQQLAQLLQLAAEVRIEVLPLRSRPEDVALLALHYLDEANSRYGTDKRMGSALFREILAYSWPGNEQQLKNFVEQLVLSAPGQVLDDPELIHNTARLAATLIPAWRRSSVSTGEKSLKEQVTEYELMIIRQSIAKYGSLRKAAAALKVDPSVLSRKLAAGKE
jgi:DNA-binding NtrC family response regulator